MICLYSTNGTHCSVIFRLVPEFLLTFIAKVHEFHHDICEERLRLRAQPRTLRVI